MEEDERICFSLSLYSNPFICSFERLQCVGMPCAIADIQHIDISSTWKRNSWQICHIMCCSVTRTARVWCGQWDKLWFSTLCVQPECWILAKTYTKKHIQTLKEGERKRAVETHANDVDQWQKLWVFNRRDTKFEEIYEAVLITQTMCRIAVRFIYICI